MTKKGNKSIKNRALALKTQKARKIDVKNNNYIENNQCVLSYDNDNILDYRTWHKNNIHKDDIILNNIYDDIHAENMKRLALLGL